MELQFLGTGAGMPSKERNTTAIMLKLLEEIGEMWLFDCGEATQHQILQTPLKPRRVTKIFITHLHGDHIFGLPGFLSSRSFQGGEEGVTLYGPKGLQAWIELTLATTGTHLTYPIHYVEVSPGVIFEDEHFIVEADLLAHVIDSYGYRITQKDLPGELDVVKARALGVPNGPLLGQLKRGEDVCVEGIVITSAQVVGAPRKGFVVTLLGDTSFTETAIRLSKHADIVVHEATFDHTMQDLAKRFGHATVADAARVAEQAGARHLILTHISGRFLAQDYPRLLEEAQAIFPQTVMAHDFCQFSLYNNELNCV